MRKGWGGGGRGGETLEGVTRPLYPPNQVNDSKKGSNPTGAGRVCLSGFLLSTRSHPWGAAASGSLGWWPSTDPEMQAHPYKELRPPGFLIRKRSERYRSGLRE